MIDDLQAADDWGTEHEDIRNDNSRTDNGNEVDADGVPVDDMGKKEGKQTNKVSAECEESGDHNYDMNGEWKGDNANTEFENDICDLTNIPILRQSKRLTAGLLPNRYGFEKYQLVEEHISDTDGVPKTHAEAGNSRFLKEWMEVMRSKIASLENPETWNLVAFPKERNVIQTKWYSTSNVTLMEGH